MFIILGGHKTAGKEIRMGHVFMMITKDRYELPLAVADTRRELGRMLGVSPVTIANSITRARNNGQKSQYIRVDFPDGNMD